MSEVSQDGLKKKFADLQALHEEVTANLALFQQRCKDLETERATYLASHAALVRSKTPHTLPLPALAPTGMSIELILQLVKVVLLIVLILVVAFT